MDSYDKYESLHGAIKELEKMSVKIWGIISGPTSREDTPDSEDWPIDAEFVLVCKAEVDGDVFDGNFYFEELNDAYEWSSYFYDSIEPLVISGYKDDS